MTPVATRPASSTFGKILRGSLHSSAMLTESSKPTIAKNAREVAAVTAKNALLSLGESKIDIGHAEYKLLKFFLAHPERVFSRSQLLDKVWGDHVFVEERTVDVHIRRLRMALEGTGHDRLVQTVRGSGYRFAALSS